MMAAQNNSNLKPKEISEAVKKLDWDPSIQAMAVLPDVVKELYQNINLVRCRIGDWRRVGKRWLGLEFRMGATTCQPLQQDTCG
jgi:hypothetical protein